MKQFSFSSVTTMTANILNKLHEHTGSNNLFGSSVMHMYVFMATVKQKTLQRLLWPFWGDNVKLPISTVHTH